MTYRSVATKRIVPRLSDEWDWDDSVAYEMLERWGDRPYRRVLDRELEAAEAISRDAAVREATLQSFFDQH